MLFWSVLLLPRSNRLCCHGVLHEGGDECRQFRFDDLTHPSPHLLKLAPGTLRGCCTK